LARSCLRITGGYAVTDDIVRIPIEQIAVDADIV
jgi:hypothetical protein